MYIFDGAHSHYHEYNNLIWPLKFLEYLNMVHNDCENHVYSNFIGNKLNYTNIVVRSNMVVNVPIAPLLLTFEVYFAKGLKLECILPDKYNNDKRNMNKPFSSKCIHCQTSIE